MKRIFQCASLCCVLTVLFFSTGQAEVHAQSDSLHPVVEGGLGFMLGFPVGEFKQNIEKTGIGLSGHIGYVFPQLPFVVGLEFGFVNYGTERRQEPFSTTIPDVTVDVETTNNLALAHMLFRIEPNEGMFRPYLDGMVGLHYLYTSTSIQNKGKGDEEVASSTNFDDVTFSIGGGGGFMVRVYNGREDILAKRKEGKESGIMEALIDIHIHYLSGGNAEYLKEGSIRRDQTTAKVTYDVSRSRTDILTAQIGVVLRF